MTNTHIAAAVLTAGAWLSLVSPVRAQIATYENDRGKVVYVNSDSPPARSGSTISPASAERQTTAKTRMFFASPQSHRPAVQPEGRLDRIVREAAGRHQVDPALVKAVISTESGWNPRAVSRKGAVGLMQLIPGTAQRFGAGNPFDPAQNVEAGTTYLKTLLDRYGGDLSKSLAAYNAGERAVDQSNGVPWYPETQRYVRKVTNAYFQPGSGRDSALWSAPKPPVRKEVDAKGRAVFTNE